MNTNTTYKFLENLSPTQNIVIAHGWDGEAPTRPGTLMTADEAIDWISEMSGYASECEGTVTYTVTIA
jgi:hypothetical protein